LLQNDSGVVVIPAPKLGQLGGQGPQESGAFTQTINELQHKL
jgi:hypothetical protein